MRPLAFCPVLAGRRPRSADGRVFSHPIASPPGWDSFVCVCVPIGFFRVAILEQGQNASPQNLLARPLTSVCPLLSLTSRVESPLNMSHDPGCFRRSGLPAEVRGGRGSCCSVSLSVPPAPSLPNKGGVFGTRAKPVPADWSSLKVFSASATEFPLMGAGRQPCLGGLQATRCLQVEDQRQRGRWDPCPFLSD